jgi:rfaE bifunctional protein kinase chain/domain
MTPERFETITAQYPALRMAVVGDFCLDRYLEIDPSRQEISIETGLPVYNVTKVRAQPGGAGTVLNNLVALGVGKIYPVGFAGDDGEGYELRWGMAEMRGVALDYFVQTRARQTFTYCKPLVMAPGQPPRELNRLDKKNWTPTSPGLAAELGGHVTALAPEVNAFILLGQVDLPETGVLNYHVLDTVARLVRAYPKTLIMADNRLSLREFPPVIFKMNNLELAALTGTKASADLEEIGAVAVTLARKNQRPVFVTLAERGMLGATPSGQAEHVPALPTHGEIDIVGAGDAVSANLIAALAAKATLREAMELASAAASIAIHQLGTTGAATVEQLKQTLFANRESHN